MGNIDEKDRKILDILEKDARTPYTEIAKELGVSEATVRKRIRSLKEDGIIKRCTIEVDPSKLGYDTITIIGLDVEAQNLLRTVDQIRALESVRWAAKSTGDHMIMAEIWTRGPEELSEIINEKIETLDGVMEIKPAILLEKRYESRVY